MDFINKEVLKNLLNGLMIKSTIKKIDTAVHIHIFLVTSVKIVKLNVALEYI